MKSQNISIRPVDKRCRFLAFVLRNGQPLPAPEAVDSYHTMPGVRSPLGDDEIFAGDVVFMAEAMHHTKQRGWIFWVYFLNANGDLCRVANPKKDVKDIAKAANMPDILAGAGSHAALVRVAHLVRAGLFDDLATVEGFKNLTAEEESED